MSSTIGDSARECQRNAYRPERDPCSQREGNDENYRLSMKTSPSTLASFSNARCLKMSGSPNQREARTRYYRRFEKERIE
jgi:hypothetical protein